MDNTNTSSPKTSSDAMKMIQKDIKAKWDKFFDQELTSLKSRDDLVTQVVAKYGFERPQAQRDVDALLKGREIGQRAQTPTLVEVAVEWLRLFRAPRMG